MMKIDLERHVPPGANINVLKNTFWSGIFLASIFSLIFFLRYSEELNELYEWDGYMRLLIPGKKMMAFTYVLGRCMHGFLILSVGLCGFIGYYYSYFYQESKSIYLMRRLQDPYELYRRCFAAPMMYSVLSLGIAAIITLIYFIFYILVTPKECLPVFI